MEKKIEIKKIEEKARVIEEKRKLEQERRRKLRNIEIIERKIKLTEDVRSWNFLERKPYFSAHLFIKITIC